MSDRDDELQRILRQWEAPAPGPDLDRRVWDTRRRVRTARGRFGMKRWLPLAAGVVLMAGIARIWAPDPAARDVSVATTTDAAGFTPLPNGAITVVKQKEKQ